MQGVTFNGSQSAYSHQNQGSGDQYSHMSDIERNIIQFLHSQHGADGIHVAAIGRAIKADPPMVRSVLSSVSAVLVPTDAIVCPATRSTNWWRAGTCSLLPTTTMLPSR